MPTGLNIATCLHCGRQWVVGDCIPCICPECETTGHTGMPIPGSCPVCEARWRAVLLKGEALVAARLERERADAEAERAREQGRRQREAEFAAGLDLE